MKLYFFNSGTGYSHRGLFINGGGDAEFNTPIPFYLIQYKGKNILFDTGNHKEDMNGHLLERLTAGFRPEFTDEQYAPNAIQKVGVKPEEIDIIIMSHLHHDHAGAIAEFPNATVIVQQSEYDYVRRPDYFMTGAYYNDESPARVSNWDGNKVVDAMELDAIDWYFLHGEKKFDLFNDGRIIICATPGHTVGHSSLFVRTDKDGDFLLCADACYVQESLDQGVLPGLVADSVDYLQSLKFLQLQKKLGVTVVTGHDPEGWKAFRHAPEAHYE